MPNNSTFSSVLVVSDETMSTMSYRILHHISMISLLLQEGDDNAIKFLKVFSFFK